MFEQSLLGTSGRERRRGGWIALGAVAIQVVALTGFIVGPLLYPATMPAYRSAELKTISLVEAKPKPVVVKKPVVAREQPSSSAAPVAQTRQVARSGGAPPIARPIFDSGAPVLLPVSGGDRMGSNYVPVVGSGTGAGAAGPTVVVARTAGPAGPLKISTGVSAGLLLEPIRPIYPEIAKASHVSGTVVVTATIDKSGRLVGLQVLSGPVMLQKAAADAVRDARYRPYLLNGQPVEVVTTFSVNFVMG